VWARSPCGAAANWLRCCDSEGPMRGCRARQILPGTHPMCATTRHPVPACDGRWDELVRSIVPVLIDDSNFPDPVARFSAVCIGWRRVPDARCALTRTHAQRHLTPPQRPSPNRVGLSHKEKSMSVVLQSGGSAIPADSVAIPGSVSAYATRQFAIYARACQGARVPAAQPSGAPEVTRRCAAG
jgi:hypothetical protein